MIDMVYQNTWNEIEEKTRTRTNGGVKESRPVQSMFVDRNRNICINNIQDIKLQNGQKIDELDWTRRNKKSYQTALLYQGKKFRQKAQFNSAKEMLIQSLRLKGGLDIQTKIMVELAQCHLNLREWTQAIQIANDLLSEGACNRNIRRRCVLSIVLNTKEQNLEYY
ncbi:uncharacterized protein LOC111694705 [Eurytemora carolleeae]|uniref:uncharacterized protein LOC111694705 n=1 Tax=Eurytemora carolleeae TaxID=1294199 RepID=UPI000C774424|nr:uncharacterized protein LOC111694705 [Eurytemora carolleeae]|eukprot:XP_023319462.1 uncharacterized protein LOC111694705 [Eurytemora affinis]